MTKAQLRRAVQIVEEVEHHLVNLHALLRSAGCEDLLQVAYCVAAGAAKLRMDLYASACVLAEAKMKEHREAAGMEADPLVPLDETPDVPSDEIA